MKKLITSSSTLWSFLIAMVMMMASQGAWADYTKYIKLTAVDGWAAYSNESYSSLVDANPKSKWGTWFQPEATTWADERVAYVIVKVAEAVVPSNYFLLTAEDAASDPNCNWSSWKIFGGNFESDELAVRDVENFTGWTLLDEKTDEIVPVANSAGVTYKFDYTGEEAFQYFWIEITAAAGYGGDDNDSYMKMAEWGLCDYKDFQDYMEYLETHGTSTDEPVRYSWIASSKGHGGEGAENLFDGNTGTKWCYGIDDGAYVIFKTSRAMALSYYKLITGGDTGSYPGRNWKKWKVFGMNADNVEDVTRNSEAWVLLDDKDDVPAGLGMNKLAAADVTASYFTPSENVETEFVYFKVELYKNADGGTGTQQMSELSLGDQYTMQLDRGGIANAFSANFDPEAFAEKALKDDMASVIDAIANCEDGTQFVNLMEQADELESALKASATAYAELVTAYNQALNAIAGGGLDDEAVAYLTAWTGSDVIAPSDEEYPCGNFAYIQANCQLTAEQAKAEAARINVYIINHGPVPSPINTEAGFYTHIAGSGGFGGEDDAMLYDGVAYGGQGVATKWCTNTWPAWTIFKAGEPIQPTYYGLVTGGDTHQYPGRNWKTWKIWGANFDEEPNPDDPNFDPAAVRNSDAWVLIDEKNNIGEDILHTDNEFESYIYLSIGCTVPYKYFKIEVSEAVAGDLIQMNEFTFYNIGNLMEYRESFVSEFDEDAYDPAESVAYAGYINGYKEKLAELKTTVNAPDVMKIKNELVDLQGKIEASADLYEKYDSVYQEVEAADIASASLSAWQTAYTSENIAPCAQYIRGTHANIIGVDAEGNETNLGALNDEEIAAEMDYLGWILNANDPGNECYYILLGGNTVGQWGDGFYGHLIDGIALNTTETDAEGNTKEIRATKWGGQADPDGNTYIIFRTQDPTSPFFYTLTTGNDTGSYPGRNWGTWYIYGANFEGDGAATKDAEGWTLIDKKEDVGQDRLHPVNAQPSYFGFSEEQSSYTYYKVVVTKAYEGNAIQMNEIYFGTPEEYETLKQEYTDAANSFDADSYRADQALIDEYKATVPEIEGCTNMEALFVVNYKLETLRAGIEASKALYDKLEAKAEEYAAEAESLTASDAKDKLLAYATGNAAAPSDDYVNGNVAYILDEHELNDSIMQLELAFLEELRVAAVAVGYGDGMDITCLIVNPTFAKAGDMLKDDKNENIGREAEGWDGYIYRSATSNAENEIFAAEFVNVNAKFDINQTLTNLKNGYYKVTLNAGYRANGTLTSCNYAPLAYANDVQTYVPVLREAMADEETRWKGSYADKEVYACDIDVPVNDPAVDSVVVGYVIWGCEGAANAFAQGRFAITLVAQVTDGTLTIGVKNEGTQGGEWTAVGNYGLVYLGESADAAALAEAQACAQERITVLTEVYESDAYDGEHYASAPGFGAAQKTALTTNVAAAPFTFENLKAIGDTMESIYYTKKAYVDLRSATDKVYDKWDEFDADGAMEAAIYAVWDGLQDGTYADADAALAAKAELYAAFPDYLEITTESGKNHVTWNAFDSFTYHIQTEGTKPFVELKNIYEPLEKNEVIITFDYAATQNVAGGQVLYNTPWVESVEVKENLATLEATYEDAEPVWKTAYINVTKGIKKLGLGTGLDHGIRWYINYDATAEDVIEVDVRNFRFITMAQMRAEGGKPLNGVVGDVDGDFKVDGIDAQAILNLMSDGQYNEAADVNGDGKVDGIDYQFILNTMSDAE